MKKKALLVIIVFCCISVFTFGFLLLSRQGAQIGVSIAGKLVPGQLTVESVQGRLVDNFTLYGVSYIDKTAEISVDQVSLAWSPGVLIKKEFLVRSLDINGINIAVAETKSTENDSAYLQESSDIFTFPLKVSVKKAAVSAVTVSLPDQAGPVLIDSFQLHDSQASDSLIQIGLFTLSSPTYQIRAGGEVRIGGPLSTVLAGSFKLSPEGYSSIEGTGRLSGTPEELKVDVQLDKPFRGKLQGKIVDLTEEARWQADLFAENAFLPAISSGWPGFAFSQFKADGDGTIDTYSLHIDTNAAYDRIQDIHCTARLNGDADGLELYDTTLTLKDGKLTGTGKLGWQDTFSWKADFSGRQLNPAVIKQQWPGRLDIDVNTGGSYSDNTLTGLFDIVSVEGELRGYSLDAGGKITVDENNIAISSFFLNTDGTEVTASGNYADTLDLHFQVDSSDLSVLWPDLEGKLNAVGTVTGKRSQPVLNLDMSGASISLYGNSIGELRGSFAGDLAPGGTIDSSIRATNLIFAERKIDTVSLTVQGAVEKHLLQTEISGDDGIMKLAVEGGLADNSWTGGISRVDIDAGRFGIWHLPEPALVRLSRQENSVVDLCLSGSDSSRVCFAGKYDQRGPWQADAVIHSLPVSMIQKISGLSRFESFEDELTGTFSLAGTKKELTSGQLSLAADNLSVRFMLDDNMQRTVSWQKNTLYAMFNDNQLTLTINSTLQDGSFLVATAIVDDFDPTLTDPEKMVVEGKVEFNVRELNHLSVFTFPAAEPYGAMKGEITLQGSIAHPAVHGHAALEKGKMIIPSLGITLEDLSIRLNGNERLLNLSVSGNSGSGSLAADGVIAIEGSEADSVTFNFRGDNFEILHLPEWHLNVSPELELILTREQGELKGTIVFQEGMLSPHSLAGSVSASRDVVITDAEPGKEHERWPFFTDVTVVIEDRVRVNTFGLKGSVAGKLQIEDQPGKPATGTGELKVVDGTFAIYGRELDIKTGQLLFSGGAVDNPGVAVRAENTTQGVKAGIAVSGFLKEPEISFYSDPPMEDNEIISRLLMNTSLVSSKDRGGSLIDSVASNTGLDPLSETVQDVKETLHVDDVRIESGKTSEELSLVIGTWLTPSLYVSYGKNLLKESGSFNTSYVLGGGFSVETETGSTASGFDLKFEIDR